MGRSGPRLKSRNGRRWAKGESSVSNPSFSKYRDASGYASSSDSNGKSSLTEELKKLDERAATTSSYFKLQSTAPSEKAEYSASRISSESFVSDWNICSNPSFAKIIHSYDPKSELHREMLSLLGAVSELIKNNEGTGTSTEYFGCLMVGLETCTPHVELTVAALASLVRMGIGSVPEVVLVREYTSTVEKFRKVLEHYAESDNNVILSSTLFCLGVVLEAQPRHRWSTEFTIDTYNLLLSFATSPKPKIRRCVRYAVTNILTSQKFLWSEDALRFHPAAAHTARVLTKTLEENAMIGHRNNTLTALAMLSETLHVFPTAELKAACEGILKVLTLGNEIILVSGLEALHGMFKSCPSKECLTLTLCAQLIGALYDYQPSPTDIKPTISWALVIEKAYKYLGSHDMYTLIPHLPRFFKAMMSLMESEHKELISSIAQVIESVIWSCLVPFSKLDCWADFEEVPRVIKIIQSGLGYQFRYSWSKILHVIGTFFDACGSSFCDLLLPILTTLGELHDSIHKFPCIDELEHVVGKAIKTVGPRKVLQAIPLEITGEESDPNFNRSWLLPLLQENIQNSELAFFTNYFLPLAKKCRLRSEELKATEPIRSHSYDLIHTQIYGLLPSFCNQPTDVAGHFKGLAQTLGNVLNNCPDLRTMILAALRKIIQSSKTDEDTLALARFGKNYLPILFNLYLLEPQNPREEGQRLSTYETIKVYLTITPNDFRIMLFHRAYEKALASSDDFTKGAVLDLIRSLLPYLKYQQISLIYEKFLEHLPTTGSRSSRKKVFKLLEDLCSTNSYESDKFVKKNKPKIVNNLVSTSSSSDVLSRGPRTRCLIQLVKNADVVDAEILKLIVPEAVLCCMDCNEKCRNAARLLLKEIALGLSERSNSDSPPSELLKDLLTMIMQGLSAEANSSIRVASIRAIRWLLIDLEGLLTSEFSQYMLESMCQFVKSPMRPVVCEALLFVHAFLKIHDAAVIKNMLKHIMESLLNMSDDIRNHFRLKCRDILCKLGRMFGFDAIKSMVPETDIITHKRLRNLSKLEARKRRRRLTGREDTSDEESDSDQCAVQHQPKTVAEILADSSDDSDKEDTTKSKQRKPRSKRVRHASTSTWITENPDNIIDLTDLSSSRSISSTDPARRREQQDQKKIDALLSFTIDSSGRIVVSKLPSSSSSGVPHVPLFKKVNPEGMESDSDDDTTISVPMKRLSLVSKQKDSSSSSSSHPSPVAKYRAIKRGIHRFKSLKRTSSTSEEISATSSGSEYKARKAKGDMKRPGKPDPYAYVPLSRKFFNRRFRRMKAKSAEKQKTTTMPRSV